MPSSSPNEDFSIVNIVALMRGARSKQRGWCWVGGGWTCVVAVVGGPCVYVCVCGRDWRDLVDSTIEGQDEETTATIVCVSAGACCRGGGHDGVRVSARICVVVARSDQEAMCVWQLTVCIV